MRLQHKVALITGLRGEIARAIALRFVQEGAIIILNVGEDSSIVDEIKAMGHDALALTADVRVEEQVKQMVETAVHAFGRIDICLNTASAGLFTEFSQGLTDEHLLHQLLDVDVKGTFLCCRAVTPIMQAQGSGCIINMSWDHAITGGKAGSLETSYAAAKGAVHSLSMCLARELAPAVRVNVLAPGWIDMLANQHLSGVSLIRDVPMKRQGEPMDIAEAALYLASPEASFVTGQTILVNGGTIMW